jgi:hypothetical protein
MPDYILDTCVDIESSHQNYPEYFFCDLLNNIRVRVVVGGSTGKAEIDRKSKLRELLNNLKDRNQVVEAENTAVDASENALAERIKKIMGDCPRECDDLHIFALSQVSGCLLVISRDNRMAVCRKKIRNIIGHNYCPDLKVIQTETAYRRTR